MSIGSLGNGGAWSGMQRLQPPSRDELLRDVNAREGGVAKSELRTIRATPTEDTATAAQDDSRQALLKQPFPWMPSTLPGPITILQEPAPSDDADASADDPPAEASATNPSAALLPDVETPPTRAATAEAVTTSQGARTPQDTQASRAEASLSAPAPRPGMPGLPADRLPSPAAEHYAAAGGNPLPATVGQQVNVAV